MEENLKVIDIEKIIRNSNSRLLKSLPGFVISGIKRLIHQDEINSTINRSRHLQGVPFINDILKGWNVNIIIKGRENMPLSGRFILVSNHPVGAVDALSIFSMAYRFFPDLMSPSNELLNYISNLRPLMLGINVFGRNTRETAAKIEELFESDTQIIIFPAGEVSRRIKGKISDPVWQKTFITKAVRHKRDIIPVLISGNNSKLFYFVANLRKKLGIKMYLESALLPSEMMKQRNTTITLTIGSMIPWQTLTNEKTHQEWAQTIKNYVYTL